MVGERDSQNSGVGPEFSGRPKPLTNGEFYLAMKERPDPSGLGLHPDLRELFVGQQRAYRQLYDAITQSPSGTVIAITGPFGAGKDALMDVVTTDLVASGKIQRDEIKRIHIDFDLEEGITFEEVISERRHWQYRGKPSEKSIQDHAKVKTLVVNESAYGWRNHSKESIQRQLEIAGKFLGKEVQIIVLIGDYALEDQEVVGAVGSPHEPIYIRLDPLTPDMLKEALRHRLAYGLERLPEEIGMDTLIDPKVLTSLVPNTDHPVAVMRNSLVDLGSIGGKLKPTEEPLTITGELVEKTFSKNWYDAFWEGNGGQRDFTVWLIQHINNHGNGQTMMKAMTPEEMIQACPLGIDPEIYKKRIISNFAAMGILRRVSAEPELYLPDPEVFLMAAFREMPLDLASEIGKHELKRIDEDIYWRAHMKEYQNPDKWIAFIGMCKFIYGWEESFTFGLIRNVLGTFEARKIAEKEKFEREIHGK